MPDLHGRLVILDKSNTIIAVLGHNADPAKRGNYNVPQDQWIEGIFSGTHGSSWDKDGNLYVQDWNVSGRIMKPLLPTLATMGTFGYGAGGVGRSDLRPPC